MRSMESDNANNSGRVFPLNNTVPTLNLRPANTALGSTGAGFH